MSKAKAAVMTGYNEPFEIREYELTPPPQGMAKIKLIASGICGTDLHIHRGKLPVGTPCILGHEFVGTVEELSDSDRAQYGIHPGDNVIVDIACPCGECSLCHSGDDANCIHMGVTNGGNPDTSPHFYGGFAEYNYSPVKNLIRIPSELDPTVTCIFACAGPTALHAFHLAEHSGCAVEKASVAVVQGLGPVGLFAVLYLKTLGIPHIVAVTARKRPERDALAVKLGATEIVSLEELGEDGIASRISQLSGGLGADLVFEASGNPQAVAQGMDLLRNRGMYLIPGQYSHSGKVEISPQLITFKALQLIGSSQYSVSDVHNYLNFLACHPAVHADILSLGKGYAVADTNKAIQDAKSGSNIKTLLV